MWAAPLPASATALQFTLDTSSLSGTVAQLAFDFIDGDGVVNNTVVVSDFSTDGTLGIASTTGGVSITDPPAGPFPVTLGDTDLFNEFLQELTLGMTVHFTLNLTQNGSGSGIPDSFSFFLLDNAFLPLFDTDDPTGAGALFAVDINGTSSGVLYNFAPTDTDSRVTWTVAPVASIPLPSTALLIGAGLLGGLAARRRVVQVASSGRILEFV